LIAGVLFPAVRVAGFSGLDCAGFIRFAVLAEAVFFSCLQFDPRVSIHKPL
jgi:hypothetical protein